MHFHFHTRGTNVDVSLLQEQGNPVRYSEQSNRCTPPPPSLSPCCSCVCVCARALFILVTVVVSNSVCTDYGLVCNIYIGITKTLSGKTRQEGRKEAATLARHYIMISHHKGSLSCSILQHSRQSSVVSSKSDSPVVCVCCLFCTCF